MFVGQADLPEGDLARVEAVIVRAAGREQAPLPGLRRKQLGGDRELRRRRRPVGVHEFHPVDAGGDERVQELVPVGDPHQARMCDRHGAARSVQDLDRLAQPDLVERDVARPPAADESLERFVGLPHGT